VGKERVASKNSSSVVSGGKTQSQVRSKGKGVEKLTWPGLL